MIARHLRLRRPILAAAAAMLGLMLTPATGSAQVGIGIAGGSTLGMLYGDSVEASSTRSGPYFGAYAQWQFDRWAFLKAGVNYLQEGGENVTLNGTDSLTDEMKYIEVPLLIGLDLPFWTHFSLQAAGGVAVSFLDSCGVGRGRDPALSECDSSTPGAAAQSTQWTIPVSGGFGFTIPDTDLTLMADARYAWGLTDAFESSDAKTGTWVFRARIEYLFH
jgi:Outer membrane protein beta-barrel domain